MNTQHDFCPGCGAQVYPEEAQCPFCGRSLRRHLWVPVAVGLGGTVVAVVSGALVWWVLSSPAPSVVSAVQQQAQLPSSSLPPPAAAVPLAPPPVSAAPPEAPPEPAAEATASPSVAPPTMPAALSPEPPPALPPALSPASPEAPAKDQAVFASTSPLRGALGTSAPLPPVVPEVARVEPAPAPLSSPTAEPPAPVDVRSGVSAEERRTFAKSKQDSFAQNGLDLQVVTSGAEDTTLVIKFNFSAKTAAELIIAGPFPRQCAQRGFKSILFEDPSGATWAYDIATQQMTQK